MPSSGGMVKKPSGYLPTENPTRFEEYVERKRSSSSSGRHVIEDNTKKPEMPGGRIFKGFW